MTGRALYLPTDRPCVPAIGWAAAEAAAIGDDCLLVLVEHRDAPHVAEHARALADRDVRSLHLTVSQWDGVLDALLERFPDAEAAWLRGQLAPSGLSYGAGPNKAFLLAAAVGVDVLHRRDSDVAPQVVDGVPRFAGVLEAEAIGRRFGDLDVRGAGGVDPDGVVRFVGTACVGDAPQDRRDVLAAGFDHAVRLQALTRPAGYEWDEVAAEVRHYFVDEGALVLPDDFYASDAHELRSEMSAACLKDVFLDLPEMAMAASLGTDYRQRNVLSQLGEPMLFQSRKVEHVYGAERNSDRTVAAAVDYSMRDLRLVMLWVASWRQAELVRADRAAFTTGGRVLDVKPYADSLDVALAGTVDEMAAMPARYAAVHREAAESAVDSRTVGRLIAIADHAERHAVRLHAEVVEGIQDYSRLMRHWPALVDAATTLEPLVRKLIVD